MTTNKTPGNDDRIAGLLAGIAARLESIEAELRFLNAPARARHQALEQSTEALSKRNEALGRNVAAHEEPRGEYSGGYPGGTLGRQDKERLGIG